MIQQEHQHLRNTFLDVFRGVAVLLVLFRHARLPSEPGRVLMLLERGGWIGVDLFFVLSGFLVSGILFAEWRTSGRVRLGRFLIRRAFKIYPQFYVLLAITTIPWVSSRLQTGPDEWIGELFFLQNYIGRIWPQTWSLAVEEHFYLALALLIGCLIRIRRTAGKPFGMIPWVFCVTAVGCQGLRLGAWLGQSRFSHEEFLYPTHLRIDSLMFGVLLSYGWNFGALKDGMGARHPKLLMTAGGLLLLPAFVWQSEHYPAVTIFGVVTNYLGAGMVLLGGLGIKSWTGWWVPVLAEIGKSSYSIYLWHILIGLGAWELSTQWVPSGPFRLCFPLYFVGSITIGMLVHHLFEVPVLAFRNRVLRA